MQPAFCWVKTRNGWEITQRRSDPIDPNVGWWVFCGPDARYDERDKHESSSEALRSHATRTR